MAYIDIPFANPIIRVTNEAPPAGAPVITNGPLRLVIDPRHWQSFQIYVTRQDGQEELAGTSIPADVPILADGSRLPVEEGACSWNENRHQLTCAVKSAGATWLLQQTFQPGHAPGAIAVTTTIEVNRQDRCCVSR